MTNEQFLKWATEVAMQEYGSSTMTSILMEALV